MTSILRFSLVLAVFVQLIVSLPAGARDWFVDSSAPAGGDGSATAPLQSLRAVQEASEPGDAILLRPGSGPYAGGIVLKEAQTLTASGGRAVIANREGDGIVLAPRTSVSGITVRAATHAAIRGRAIGEITLRQVILETSGLADGLVLLETAGSVTVEGGESTGSGSGAALVIDGGSGPIAFSKFAIAQNDGAAIVIRNSASPVSFEEGSIAVTAGSRDAILLTENRSAIAIGAPLRITTVGAAALIIRDCKSVSITGTGSTLTANGARGVHISGSEVLADLATVSVDGGTATVPHAIVVEKMTGRITIGGGTIRNIRERGIVIDHAGNITLRNVVLEQASTENAARCGRPTAGADYLACNAAIYLHETHDVVLDGVRIAAAEQQGIHGDAVRNFTLTNGDIAGAGDEVDESGVLLRNVSGDVRFSSTKIHGSASRQIEITNDGGEAAIELHEVTLAGAANGQRGIL